MNQCVRVFAFNADRDNRGLRVQDVQFTKAVVVHVMRSRARLVELLGSDPLLQVGDMHPTRAWRADAISLRDPVDGTYTKVPNGGYAFFYFSTISQLTSLRVLVIRLLVYYENRGNADPSNGGPGLKAPPAGFRMLSGSAAKRAQIYPVGQGSQGELAERALIGMCLRYTTNKLSCCPSDQVV